jgi:hypothetical protein
LWVTTLETTGGGGGGGGEEITAPTAPAAPLVTKNCAGSTLVVSNPAWDTNEAHPTSTLEIERSDDGGATWTPVHTFTVAGGTWVDASALKYIAYEYRARGVNSEGESAWSAITTITLQSATLAIVILAPVNAATLAGEQLLRFSLADAGAPGVLTPDIEVSINGKPYNVAPTIETPNACIADNIEAFNTIYVLPFDTRDWNNGAKSIRVEAKGTDGCRAKADRAVTFNNTLKTQIFFRDFLASAAMTGHVIGSASIGVELRARAAGLTLLEANARRRYFMETGTRNGTALDDDFTDEAWNAHSPVVWTRGAGWDEEGTRLARLQLFARVFYASPLSAHVRTREKWTPEFDLSLWETAGLPVVKVRSIATGKHLVFVRNNVDAKVFRYTEDGLAEIVLSPTCPDARDAIESGGKIYIVRATGAVRCYDADSGEATFRDVSPAGETRVAKFIEVVGGKVLLLCTDVNSTRCYDLSFAAPKLLWTLAAVATFAVSNDGKLWLAAGAALYGSDAGTAAPTLVKAFASNVVSFWRPDCGLADGTVMRHDGVGAGGNGWSQVADIGAFAHVARWTGGIPGESIEDDARGVAGGLDTWLTGEMQNGSWLDERELMVPAEVEAEVTKTTALDVFSVETGAASETQPAQRDERLLIGTDAGLFVYTRSVITEAQGAVRLSHDTLQRITPYPQPAPVA